MSSWDSLKLIILSFSDKSRDSRRKWPLLGHWGKGVRPKLIENGWALQPSASTQHGLPGCCCCFRVHHQCLAKMGDWWSHWLLRAGLDELGSGNESINVSTFAKATYFKKQILVELISTWKWKVPHSRFIFLSKIYATQSLEGTTDRIPNLNSAL